MNTDAANDWWFGGVIYQIYPRSFYDSNNDGIGDLRGVMSKLPYLKSLGVDGIWLSPFFKSPMKDFGYDISDYEEIDPIFGTMDDFDALLKAAHELDIKLVIDQVYSHTSDQHEWFKESRRSKDNPKSDWYIWAEAKADGGPPNNWISLFGGQAWSWDSRRKQYYMHNFLSEQPDLNFHNPEVRAEVLRIAKSWLDRGIDGFRLDVANFYFCDPQLRDNPPKSPDGGYPRPYWHQRHLYDRSQPENLEFMEEFRALVDQYPGCMTVAEIGSDSYIDRSIEYTEPGRLHTAYNFLLLENGPLSATLIRDTLESWTSKTAWPSWSFSNHDVVRARTRWGGEDAGDEFAQMLMGILLSLRGTIFLYQGDELGLPQADVPFDRLQDPEGIRFWPDSLGRDGCRTPLPWDRHKRNGGFSDLEPWLPVDPKHTLLSVDQQDEDPLSTLNITRELVAFRRRNDILRRGDIDFLKTPEPLLAFRRSLEGESIICAFNISDEQLVLDLPKPGEIIPVGLRGSLDGQSAILPAFGGVIVKEST